MKIKGLNPSGMWLRTACLGFYSLACCASAEVQIQELELSAEEKRANRLLVFRNKSAASELEDVNLVFLTFPPLEGRTSRYFPIGSGFAAKTMIAVDDFLSTGKKAIWVSVEHRIQDVYLLTFEQGTVKTLYTTDSYAGMVWSRIQKSDGGRWEIHELWKPEDFPEEEGKGTYDPDTNCIRRVMVWNGKRFSPKK